MREQVRAGRAVREQRPAFGEKRLAAASGPRERASPRRRQPSSVKRPRSGGARFAGNGPRGAAAFAAPIDCAEAPGLLIDARPSSSVSRRIPEPDRAVSGDDRHAGHRRAPQVSAVSDQAVALRRRRLRHPVAQVGAAVQLARLPLRHRQGRDRSRRARPRRRRRDLRRSTRPTPASGRDGHRPADRRGRRARASSASSACSRTSSRASWTSPGPCARRACTVCIGGFHVSGCLAMLPETPGFAEGGARPRDLAVRRRGGGPLRRRAARRRRRNAEADLQLPRQSAGPRRRRPRPSCRKKRSAGRSA